MAATAVVMEFFSDGVGQGGALATGDHFLITWRRRRRTDRRIEAVKLEIVVAVFANFSTVLAALVAGDGRLALPGHVGSCGGFWRRKWPEVRVRVEVMKFR